MSIKRTESNEFKEKHVKFKTNKDVVKALNSPNKHAYMWIAREEKLSEKSNESQSIESHSHSHSHSHSSSSQNSKKF
jgi:hypothetical protein